MIQLDRAVTAIQNVLAGQLFDVPGGPARTLIFYKGEMPGKRRGGSGRDGDVSYCLVQPGNFRMTRQGLAMQVRATFVLFSAGDEAAGLAMVETTINNLTRLAGERYMPCSLVGEITGNAEQFEHPHYWLELTLQLSTINEAQL